MAATASSSQNEGLELEMTPMIDVVFLLLIFFLINLEIPEEEGIIETNLPKAVGTGKIATEEKEKEREEFEDITLRLAWNPTTEEVKRFVNRQPMLSDEMLLGTLKNLKEVYAKGRVVVQCQDEVPYASLVQTISLVQEAEMPMGFAGL
ncbi:MAG: biopolymer transporter ExbD [Planctomycetes bacterium]|nr:biopolymer transporter ExbD [Planctomycetota bacterium]